MTVRALDVSLRFAPDHVISVGSTALAGRELAFEYAADFLQAGLPISPFRLPLRAGACIHDRRSGTDAFGLFDDAMPDAWGRRLIDRHFQRVHQRLPDVLERLALVGERGMGALTFQPADEETPARVEPLSLAELAREAWAFDEERMEDALPRLRQAAGTSGGARPKALIGVPSDPKGKLLPGDGDLPPGYQHWLVKFNTRLEGREAGVLESIYMTMACAAGADVPEHRLLETRAGRFFAVRRFDRLDAGGRLHLHSAAGLLNTDFRIPGEEYSLIFRLLDGLTRDHHQKLELFRRACLNVLACNRDDHLKNFAFLMGSTGRWHLSPLYDFTFHPGPNGWHTLSIAGNGQNPGVADLRKLANQSGLNEQESRDIIEQTRSAVASFPTLAAAAGVSKATIKRLQTQLVL